MQPTLHPEVSEPILTVLGNKGRQLGEEEWMVLFGGAHRSSTCHRSEQAVVDFDNLLHCLTCYPVPRASSGVGGDNDTTLKSESQRRCAMR